MTGLLVWAGLAFALGFVTFRAAIWMGPSYCSPRFVNRASTYVFSAAVIMLILTLVSPLEYWWWCVLYVSAAVGMSVAVAPFPAYWSAK